MEKKLLIILTKKIKKKQEVEKQLIEHAKFKLGDVRRVFISFLFK